MRTTNEFMRSIMDSPKGLMIFSLDTQYRYTTFTRSHSETMKKIWGLDIEIGMNMLDCIHVPGDREIAKSNFDRALLGEYLILDEEYGDSDLFRTWWEDRYSPVYDETNRIIGVTVVVVDITERKKMESSLSESEERFRKVFQSSPVAICIMMLEDGRLLEANTAYWELTGYDPDTSIGRNAEELKMWENPGERKEFVRSLGQKRSIRNSDDFIYHTDGTLKRVSSFYELIQISREDCILAMFYDRSGQKRMEQERENLIHDLEIKNAESETLRESLASLVGRLEFTEIIEHILDQIKRVVPYDSASIWRIDDRVQRFIAGRDVPQEIITQGIEFTVDRDNSAFPILMGDVPYILNLDVQAQLKDFQTPPHIYVNSWLAIPLKRRGEIIGLIALDGRKKNQFNEHHAGLAVIFANQVAIALENSRLFSELQAELKKQVALRGAITAISSSLNVSEVLNEICKQMVSTIDATSAYISNYDPSQSSYTVVAEYLGPQVNDLERISDFNTTYYKKDGAWVFDGARNVPFRIVHVDDLDLTPWARNNLVTFGGKSVLYMPMYVQGRLIGHAEIWESRRKRVFTQEEVSFGQAISQQAAIAIENARLFSDLQNELARRRNLITELELKNTELERFTYTVSHDLKSPLFTIRGFLGYLEKDALSGDRERLRNDTQRIADATDKMQQLLNDLLELSRIGRLMNEPQVIRIDQLIQDVLELVDGQIRERGVSVKVQDDLPSIRGDRQRISEVIQNLVENAAKFMGSQPDPRIEIGQEGEENGMPVFFVRDNGVGISAAHYDRIFGLFNKLDPGSSGTGVGLALVKRIVELHGGRIWVESEPGIGSTFFFTLPTQPGPDSVI